MRNLLSLLSLAVLAMQISGCATWRTVRQADGWTTYLVSCGGPFLNMGHCLERAGDLCRGRGYTILNKKGGEFPTTPNPIPTGGLPDIPQSMTELQEYPERKLFVKCN